MKLRDIHLLFVSNCDNQLIMNFEEYHLNLETLVNYYDIIDLNNTTNKTTDNFIKCYNLFNIGIELKKIIQKYTYILDKLKEIISNIEKYILLRSIKYEEFKIIVLEINTIISNIVLTGGTFRYYKLGKLNIRNISKTVYDKTILDQKKTKLQKQYFKDNNIEGDYRVYNNNDNYNMFVFTKDKYLLNKNYYIFKPTNFINMVDRCIENYYKLEKTVEHILSNDKIGNVQKMNALVYKDNSFKSNYKFNTKD